MNFQIQVTMSPPESQEKPQCFKFTPMHVISVFHVAKSFHTKHAHIIHHLLFILNADAPRSKSLALTYATTAIDSFDEESSPFTRLSYVVVTTHLSVGFFILSVHFYFVMFHVMQH